jgi:hypothetical protein
MPAIEISAESEWAEANLLAGYCADHPGQVKERATELLGRLDRVERSRLSALVAPLAEASFSHAFDFASAGLADSDDRVRLSFAEQLGAFARNEHTVYDVVLLLRIVGDSPNLRSSRSPFIAGLKSVQRSAGPTYLQSVLERGSRPPRYRAGSTVPSDERQRDRRIQASFVEATRHFAHLLHPAD